jgi:hypothetical protein
VLVQPSRPSSPTHSPRTNPRLSSDDLYNSSHLLQLLNVACFLPLKRAYGDEILALARDRIYYINKQTFFLAFKVAFKKAFIRENAYAGF